MKKLFLILAVASLAACNENKSSKDSNSESISVDSSSAGASDSADYNFSATTGNTAQAPDGAAKDSTSVSRDSATVR